MVNCNPNQIKSLLSSRILVVDDQVRLTDVVVHLLRKNGYETTAYNDSVAAWNYIASNRAEISLVITDLDMPVLTGYGLIRLMYENNVKIPIIVASADLTRDEQLLEKCGVSHQLHKPFMAAQLLAMVESVIGTNQKKCKGVAFQVRKARFQSSRLKRQHR